MPEVAFTISDWKPYVKNSLQAFFTLTLPSGLVLHNCMYHKKPSGVRWIGMPSQRYQTAEGTISYTPIAEFANREAEAHFREECLKAIDKMSGAK